MLYNIQAKCILLKYILDLSNKLLEERHGSLLLPVLESPSMEIDILIDLQSKQYVRTN